MLAYYLLTNVLTHLLPDLRTYCLRAGDELRYNSSSSPSPSPNPNRNPNQAMSYGRDSQGFIDCMERGMHDMREMLKVDTGDA